MFSLYRLARIFTIAVVFGSLIVMQHAVADDWVATKLRGNVFAFDGAAWGKLSRGDVISDNRTIRTTRSGRAEFVREKERISIGGDTQISIADRTGKRYTTVRQDYGRVEIEAEKRNVKHFSVTTPYLAAVVKGTKFVVTVTDERAKVSVSRGTVNVADQRNKLMVDITSGQTASAGQNDVLSAAGRGVALITRLDGTPISDANLAMMNGNGGGSNGGGSNGGDGGLGNAIGGSVGGVVGGVGDGLGGAVSGVGGAVGGVGDALGGGLGDALGGVGDALGGIGGGLGGLL